MSILIRGMEMPKSCGECAIKSWDGEDDVCPFSGISALSIGRQDDCPLVPVPPHGDLIDRDAIKETFCGNCFADEKPMECPEPCMDMRIILDASTIIPAEEGE